MKLKIFGIKALYPLITLSFTYLFVGCSELRDEILAPELQVSSCEGCHTNHVYLKQVASPDTTQTPGGCGGDTPHIEPYDRVFMGGEGYEKFKNSSHGRIPCTSCHGGTDGTADKKLAHSGNFTNHPSDQPEKYCTPCHATTVHNFTNSLHQQGWGQKSMVTLRMGVNSFEQLPRSIKEGYETNCARCHASCGDCHVNRPPAGGGGLYKGHEFRRTPSMTDNCTACHTSRVGHAYFGIASGTSPDVHLTKLGNGTCLNCHSGREMHGNSQLYDQRYKMPMLPRCETCHAQVATSNIYHSVHINTFNCQTCHSQDYNNCGSCHIGGAGARIPAYLGFKIAVNPIPETKPYKFATVRRALMAPDSWQNYGVAQLPNFDVRPTYKYATPHNIQRWTKRTQVAAGKPCFDACHIIKEGAVYRNKELYLFNSDLLPWEVNANRNIVVDQRLPASWGVQ